MASKLEDLLPEIVIGQDAGLTIGKLRAKFVGKLSATTKDREATLAKMLASLVRDGAAWGPLKHGGTQYYFAVGKGPSIEMTSSVVAGLVAASGVKLLSRAQVKKKVTGLNQKFLDDGIKHAVAERTIVELVCGSSKYYLHRDVAADYFDFVASQADQPAAPADPPGQKLDLADLLPVYRRLKAEQGGFSAVKMFDLLRVLGCPKEVLHRLLIEEAKAGRVTIHPTTSVELPAEAIDAGIKLPGSPEPFVTVVVKGES